MAYPLPAGTGNITTLAFYLNDITFGWFWSIILMSFFLVLMFSFLPVFGIKRAMISASFTSLILMVLLRTMQLILDKTMWTMVLVFLGIMMASIITGIEPRK